MKWVIVLSLSFHLLLCHFPFHCCSSMEGLPWCNPDDASALLQFKSSFTLNTSASEDCIASSPKTTSWENDTNCCSWNGVTCDPVSGHVIGVDLSCSCLQGEFHPNSTIFELAYLGTLNLAYNNFISSSISSQIGNLVALTHLNLSGSSFVGEIPSQISQLSHLVSLDLSVGFSDLRLNPSTWENLVLNATSLRDLVLAGLDMSLVGPSSLSLLMNLSSSLVYLDLSSTGLQGNLEASSNILCLQNLQKLNLRNNENLHGQFPKSNWSSPLKYLDLDSTAFSGEMPDSIGHLSSLEYLILRHCQFEGPLPSTFGNLTKLKFLSLWINKFSGGISSISNLKNLTSLDLSSNNFSGQIPSSLSNLQNLASLYLSENNFSGQIPSSLSNLQNLTSLDLSENNLSGQIPSSLSNLQNLDSLYLLQNNLSGQIPSSLSNLQNLTSLDLSQNNLSGEIPYEFGKLSKLERLVLSENNLGGQLPLPLSNLTRLSTLIVRSNKLIGPVPNKLLIKSYVDLSDNLLNGTIPSSLYFSPSLLMLDLSSNMLQGNVPIPPFGTQFFSVSNNKLTGGIPSALCNVSSLSVLKLSQNDLKGLIPECIAAFPSLLALELQMNNLVGTIPGNFSERSSLQTLHFDNNQLKGPLPRSLARCKQLEILDIGDNQIKDVFPNWLEDLQELQVLVLRANKFHGTISHLHTKQPFPKLRIFDVSNNNFNGSLPTAYMKEFQGMKKVDDAATGLQYMKKNNFSSYVDSVKVTMKGIDVELKRILTTFTTIDLSNNLFEGKIPKVIGELYSLKGLNLSHNRITGAIPESLGDLKNLEWLDLSSNKLKGKIPNELTNLNFLSFLNLSQNQLVGMIPRGEQFNTFLNDSYEGNLGLCGFPLSKTCGKDEGERPPSSSTFNQDDEGFGFGWKPVVIGYGCGMIFGMLMGYVVCSTGKPQWLVRNFQGVPRRRANRRRMKKQRK